MAKRSAIDERLSALSKLRAGPVSPQTIDVLRSSLADKSSFIVAKAAKLVGELSVTALTADLVAAFNRQLAGPDKGCEATTAIAETLQTSGASEPEVYLRGIRHVQKEGSFGPPVDVAVNLRCQCAFGLVRIGYRDVMWELAALLADPEPACRAAAARAIGASHGDAGLALLKFFVLSARTDEDVINECFISMAEINPIKAIPFVARFLESENMAISESAALALGSTRRPEALEHLKAHADRTVRTAARDILLLAIATLRIEPAMAYLISLITGSDTKTASYALKALALYKRDDTLRQRVKEAAETRNDAVIRTAFQTHFG